MTDSDKAFMASFKNTHDQYEITDKAIFAFLRGDVKHFTSYFDGYTQLADAYNLWNDAITYMQGICK